MIRRANFTGPLVVIGGLMDRCRRAARLDKGADEAIDKDDLDSAAITEALKRIADKLPLALTPIA